MHDPITGHALHTSAGGRGFIADLFKLRLKRHDFTRYINERLAADFACALSAWLDPIVNRPAADVAELDSLRARIEASEQLLIEARNLIRSMAVLSPDCEFAKLKTKLDAALLHRPATEAANRVAGCADAAWLLYDGGFYGQHGVLVMDEATILQKATSYAGYKAESAQATEHETPEEEGARLCRQGTPFSCVYGDISEANLQHMERALQGYADEAARGGSPHAVMVSE